jgi:predicted anti-sigma-YlaC factor YlaD
MHWPISFEESGMIRGEAQVATDCQHIQETLTEYGGGLDRLDETQSRHLEVCPDCREAAAAERALGLLFARAIPPADPVVEENVMAALRPARIRRRVVAFLPVAASMLVALLGAVMVGGIPGSGVLGLLPEWSAQGWMAFATSVSDWGTAVATGARAAATTLDPAFLAGVGLVGFFGLVGVAVTALRWRRISPWRDDT